MNITIHRSTHEIGGSCIEITSKNSKIVIDITCLFTEREGVFKKGLI